GPAFAPLPCRTAWSLGWPLRRSGPASTTASYAAPSVWLDSAPPVFTIRWACERCRLFAEPGGPARSAWALPQAGRRRCPLRRRPHLRRLPRAPHVGHPVLAPLALRGEPLVRDRARTEPQHRLPARRSLRRPAR